ncbi:MAG: glucose-1-phosphate thymidylyltransferase [Candidatus Korarchaeota archaeon]|nr:glucose-1-phosphate thymidylyltransferase [Candidatus Korarchaeota archaeon]NIU82514.1 glucose-1-phosphate thymidylyltransferase [Candidatus Thorarchaeota archaeon]NIW13001.1 glucose-1-phosphate thymidylyltransferase [Candidatus Thorarchaeota archaeon]
MKALILSGGEGTRLRPLTYSQQKQLIPVANKPVLFYGIEDVIEAGVEEIGIITGPNADQVRSTVNSRDWDVEITFIHQGEPKGLAHTILVAKEVGFLKGEPFVMYLGDNILQGGIAENTTQFREQTPDASIMLSEVENPGRFGVADLNQDGTIKQLIEKPEDPPSNLALVGIYFFNAQILKAVEHIDYSWRDELEITDAIQWLIDNGYEVRYTKVRGWWKDTGKPGDILEANRLILDSIEREIRGEERIDNASRVAGRVQIADATVIDSIIKGPVVIGKESKIENSYIGPYTSIGKNCTLENTEIADSIILDSCKIKDTGKIVESLLGQGVELIKKKGRPKGYKLVLGDRSRAEMQ